MQEKLVKVHWQDPATITDSNLEWLNLKQVKNKAKKVFNELAVTVGFIIYETKDYIVISATRNEDLFADTSLIHKKLITKIEPLKGRNIKSKNVRRIRRRI